MRKRRRPGSPPGDDVPSMRLIVPLSRPFTESPGLSLVRGGSRGDPRRARRRSVVRSDSSGDSGEPHRKGEGYAPRFPHRIDCLGRADRACVCGRCTTANVGRAPRRLAAIGCEIWRARDLAVSGIDVRSLEVRLTGSAYADGEPLPWHSLRLVNGAWRGTLPAPARRGVYPVELRTAAGASPIKPAGLFLRVFARGTRERPSLTIPTDVVRWWVRTVPHATLVAIKAWPRSAFDRRDVRLHRRFVVQRAALPGVHRWPSGCGGVRAPRCRNSCGPAQPEAQLSTQLSSREPIQPSRHEGSRGALWVAPLLASPAIGKSSCCLQCCVPCQTRTACGPREGGPHADTRVSRRAGQKPQ